MPQPEAREQKADDSTTDNVAWAVSAGSRYTPSTSCLVQALAAQMLLNRRGYLSQLRIGVAKGDAGQFQAHAWVESDGRIIIGGNKDFLRYKMLVSPEDKMK